MADKYIIDPSGQIGRMNEDAIEGAKDLGYREALPQEIADAKEKQAMSTLPRQIETAATRMAGAASFGISDLISGGYHALPENIKTALRLAPGSSALTAILDRENPEYMKKLEEANPTAAGIGELGGYAVSPISRGVSALGKGVEAATKGLLPSAGESLAGKIISSAIPKAAGSAIEGMAYGAGQTVSEASLGDPNLNAEGVISQIGLSGLLGGALGGTIGVAEHAIPAALTKAKTGITNLRNMAFGTGEGGEAGFLGKGFAEAQAPFSGIDPDKVIDKIANRAAGLNVTEKQEIANDLSEHLGKMHEDLQETLKNVNQDIRPKEIEALLNNANPEAIKMQYDEVLNNVGNTVAKMRAEPEIYAPSYARKMEMLKDSLAKTAEGSPYEIFEKQKEIKQKIDSLIRYGKPTTAMEQDAQAELITLRKSINESLKNPEVWGEAGSRLAAFDEALSDYYKFVPPGKGGSEFQKAFMMPTMGEGTGKSFRINPVKVESYLKKAGDISSQEKTKMLQEYYEASNNLMNEVENTYKNVPNERFGGQELKDAITNGPSKIEDASEAYKNAKLSEKGGRGGPSMLSTLEHGGVGAAIAHTLGLPMKAVAGVGAAISAMDIFRNPIATVTRLAQIERQVGSVLSTIDKGTRMITNASVKGSYYGRGYISAGVASSYGKKREEAIGPYQRRIDELQKIVSNPEQMQKVLEASTKDLYEHAPNISSAMHMTAVNASQFLMSKIPQYPQNGMLNQKWEPSHAEIAKFNRYLEVVEKPMVVLKQAAAGTLSAEAVEALGAVYPTLHNEIKKSLVENLAKTKPEKVPYRNKLMISLLLGQPVDESTSQQGIMNLQQTIMGPSQQNTKDQALQRGPIKTTMGGVKNLTISPRTLTPMQSSSQRNLK